MPANSGDEIVVRSRFDVLRARGQRVQLKARARIDGAPKAFARATMTMTTSTLIPSYRDNANTSPVYSDSWTNIHTTIDIPLDATSGQIDLILHGTGTARFNDVEIAPVGLSPPPTALELSPRQITNLISFTRAAALIRYLHPSDQVATIDWNAFLPNAIEQLLHAPPRADLLDELRTAFSEIAPTVTFSHAATPVAESMSPQNGATHLVRWRRYGFGDSAPFSTYREGRDPDNTYASASLRPQLPNLNLKACKKLSFRAAGRKLAGPGKASLFARVLRPGVKKQEISEAFRDSGTEVILEVDALGDTQDVEIGIKVEGRSGVALDALAVSCDGGPQHPVDIVRGPWAHMDFTDLYTWEISKCDARPCVTFQRNAIDTAFDPKRDVLHSDIGNGIMIHLPLAVWSDASRTLPVVAGNPLLNDFTIDDAPTRLAAISAAWGTLSIFYPYFADRQTDWLAPLSDAFKEVAAARSPRETHVALSHLIAHLPDNHARVTHSGAPATGVLPITFRRFGDNIIVTGGLPEYLEAIKVGSEIEQIDGVSADQAYDQVAMQVSAATEGSREYRTPLWMGMGYPGIFRSLRIRGLDGHAVDHILPLVSDELFGHTNREARPAVGSELAPGVYYLDLDSLSASSWEKVLPTLGRASAILLDFRGYVNITTLEVMSHITNRELHSPIWQTPLIPSAEGPRYTNGHWDVRPQVPRFNAKIVALIDARAMSSVETVLQMFYENKLGVLVGETSGGTNGNVAYLDIPGGFNIRFTAMRASDADGRTVQGHGFTPDHIVHPTLEGVRAGRDEILEAGIATATRLIGP
jgi:hypothetical protein